MGLQRPLKHPYRVPPLLPLLPLGLALDLRDPAHKPGLRDVCALSTSFRHWRALPASLPTGALSILALQRAAAQIFADHEQSGAQRDCAPAAMGTKQKVRGASIPLGAALVNLLGKPLQPLRRE